MANKYTYYKLFFRQQCNTCIFFCIYENHFIQQGTNSCNACAVHAYRTLRQNRIISSIVRSRNVYSPMADTVYLYNIIVSATNERFNGFNLHLSIITFHNGSLLLLSYDLSCYELKMNYYVV